MRDARGVSLLETLLPPACAGCGRFGVALCDACVASFRAPGRADDRFLVPDPGVVVGDRVIVAIAAFAYEGAVRRVLGRVKYASAARVSGLLATAAEPSLVTLIAVAGPSSLVPVPLHPQRQRERGYNQAALIAHALGRAGGVPVRECLERSRTTERQHGLDRAARLRNLSGAFSMAAGSRPPAVAIVVDDILTTSATMEACAAVLRAAGSERVYGFALAREV